MDDDERVELLLAVTTYTSGGTYDVGWLDEELSMGNYTVIASAPVVDIEDTELVIIQRLRDILTEYGMTPSNVEGAIASILNEVTPCTTNTT